MNTRIHQITTLVAVGALLGGCKRESVDLPEEPTAVEVYVASPKDVTEEVIASGAIEAIEASDVAFMASGRVVSVEVKEGMLVEAGQLLARLDPGDYEKNLDIAEAQLEEVSSRHARLSRMYDAGSLTETDFEKIDAALKQSRSAAELARRQLGYTELRAPFAGWVEKRGIEAGVVVAPGVPVFTVRSPGPVRANLGVAEVNISDVRVGQAVDVRVSATDQRGQRGVVESILPHADPLTRAFTVKVRLENADDDLRHGNVVVGHILTGKMRPCLMVPPQAVQRNADGSLFVWLADVERDVAMRQIVEVGELRESELEITSGVKAGDQIIVNVPHTLFEGQPIAVNKP